MVLALWTGVKLHGWLKEQLGVELGYSTTVRYLHELGYNLRVPQRWPECQNEEEREAFLERIRALQADPVVELWFGDECGVEGDPRPRRRWSARGSRPKIPYLGDHIRANVDELATAIPSKPGKRMILVLDNASWHKATRLHWHHFECMFLPGYSPDFNPIERLWLRLKADFFSNFIAKTPEELVKHLCTALCHFMDNQKTVASQCSFRK